MTDILKISETSVTSQNLHSIITPPPTLFTLNVAYISKPHFTLYFTIHYCAGSLAIMYDGKSVSKLQMVIDLKQTRVLI
jgi:hypothetical protein